jgi:hypothetical protein
MTQGKCTADGCDRPSRAKGYCRRCYLRIWRHDKRPDRPCEVAGCDRTATTRGLCDKHYQRVCRNGTTDLRPPACLIEKPNLETLPPFRWNGWGTVTLIELATDWRAASNVTAANGERWRVHADGHPIGWLLASGNGTRRFTYETPDDPPDTLRPFETITRSKAIENLLAALDM